MVHNVFCVPCETITAQEVDPGMGEHHCPECGTYRAFSEFNYETMEWEIPAGTGSKLIDGALFHKLNGNVQGEA